MYFFCFSFESSLSIDCIHGLNQLLIFIHIVFCAICNVITKRYADIWYLLFICDAISFLFFTFLFIRFYVQIHNKPICTHGSTNLSGCLAHQVPERVKANWFYRSHHFQYDTQLKTWHHSVYTINCVHNSWSSECVWLCVYVWCAVYAVSNNRFYSIIRMFSVTFTFRLDERKMMSRQRLWF